MLITNRFYQYNTSMSSKLVGVVGFIGCGKGTVGDYLVSRHGYRAASFAHSLKDAVSCIFGWPRDLLEGNTPESRAWRERPDPYWSSKMERDITPRWVLQYMGTEVMRNHFIDDIWIWSLEKKLVDLDQPTVITDVRFPNEIKLINDLGGKLLWIRRNPEPTWAEMAINEPGSMRLCADVHPSEYAWIGAADYRIIWNDSSLDDLYRQVDVTI